MTFPSTLICTDLYQLTMLQGYFNQGIHRRNSCFDLFFRKHPFEGGYSIAAGLEDALSFLNSTRFSSDDHVYLKSSGFFTEEFLDHLRNFQFTGEVHAIPEGTIAFPHEPLMRISGALEECQLVETALLNIINFQSLVATKAARICHEAGRDNVLEFGLRRAQGFDGALTAARASYIGGCVATSNVEAGKKFGIHIAGTHAHSWVMAFESELEAFRAFAHAYPDNCILLVDTFHSLESGVPNAITVAHEMKEKGHKLKGVRIDSGDLVFLAKETRRLLDDAGLQDVQIVASSDLDEYFINDLIKQCAPIDIFGVGTRLVTAHGDSAFTGVYKLAAVGDESGGWRPTLKRTDESAKSSLPGIKQVWRFSDRDGKMIADCIEIDGKKPDLQKMYYGNDPFSAGQTSLDEKVHEIRPMLTQVMKDGKICCDALPLSEIRSALLTTLPNLPEPVRRLSNPDNFKVYFGQKLMEQVRRFSMNPQGV